MLLFFLRKPERLTREMARERYYHVIAGHRDCEVAAAIEGRIRRTSPNYRWAVGVRQAYGRYAKFLTPRERELQFSQRLAILDPDAGHRFSLP